MGLKEEQQKEQLIVFLSIIVISLGLWLYKQSEINEQNIREVHNFYDCVFDEMSEGKDKYKAERYCAGFEKEMQEISNEYYEEMQP